MCGPSSAMKQIYRISPFQLPHNIKHHKNCVSCSGFCTYWLERSLLPALHQPSAPRQLGGLWVSRQTLCSVLRGGCFAGGVARGALHLCRQQVEELASRALPLGQMQSRSRVLQMVSAIFVYLHVLP